MKLMTNKAIYEKTESDLTIGRDQGAAWAIAYLLRDGEIQLGERMLKEWGFRSYRDMREIDAYDAEEIRKHVPLFPRDGQTD